MKDLSGKVAIVTGAAQGLGAEFAVQLANRGVHVVIADTRNAGQTVDRVRENGQAVWARAVDIRDAQQVTSLVEEVAARHGRLDILVNNAAIAVDLSMKPFLDIGKEEFDRVMAVNVGGTFECMKAVAPLMMAQRSGKIINIASTTYMKGAAKMLHYVASKGAVIGMTRVAARELGEYGVTVNCIAPGLTMTEPVKDKGDFSGPAYAAAIGARAIQREQVPGDLVGAMLFLSSSLSDFVTGQTIVVDGGGVML